MNDIDNKFVEPYFDGEDLGRRFQPIVKNREKMDSYVISRVVIGC